MIDQIKEAIEMFGEEVDDTVATPENNNLMVVDDNCKQLDILRSEIFHSVVAKLLYIMKQA